MAGRYLVTGVQLGMLLAIDDKKAREDMLNKILKDQFIGTSEKSIGDDCKKYTKEPYCPYFSSENCTTDCDLCNYKPKSNTRIK